MRGAWPGEVRFRSGWARAHGRPWNDDLADAALRLERGSSGFLAECTRWLFDQGAPAVMSIPLALGGTSVWEAAGFAPDRQLVLFERSLAAPLPTPQVEARPGRTTDWPACAKIDRAVFPLQWRIGHLGLRDAMAATPSSVLLVMEEAGQIVGFAIIGVGYQTGYLQRLAVDAGAQGSGYGRSLVRTSLRWAARRGARTMLLNTQPDNRTAAELYRSEGFLELPERLQVLRATPEGLDPT